MGDFLHWSVNLGQYRGVRLRVHAFFLLFAILTLQYCVPSSSGDLLASGEANSRLAMPLLCLAVLFCSVIVHELGHAFAAARLGGYIEQIVIAPWGGLSEPQAPSDSQSQLLVAVGGPAVTAGVCLFSSFWLLVLGSFSGELLLSPLQSHVFDASNYPTLSLRVLLWVNWLLLLVNLLPAFPFDGGRMLRPLLSHFVGYQAAVWTVSVLAKMTAALLVVVAFWDGFRLDASVPWGVPALLIAMLLYFSANHEAERYSESAAVGESGGYDFSQFEMGLENRPHFQTGPGPIRRWLMARQAEKEKRRRLQEMDEERQLDQILERMHNQGPRALTTREQEILARVSQRYRNRPRA
jgi:Zn-dependent protease